MEISRKMDRRGSTTNKNDEVVKALVDSNTQMGKDMEFLKNRLNALEMMQPPSNGGGVGNAAAAADNTGSDQAVTEKANNNNAPK